MSSPGRLGVALLALSAALIQVEAGWGQLYSLQFTSRSKRMTWTSTIPSWSYTAPVALSASYDSTSMLRISASGSLTATLSERRAGDAWTENGAVRTSVNYPILGPKASVGITASMTSRNASLISQKIRNQTYSFRFQYRPRSPPTSHKYP